MGWDIVVQASVKLDRAGVKKWKALKPAFIAAPKGFPPPEGKPAASVAKVLSFLPARFHQISEKDGEWKLRALLDEEEFDELGAALAGVMGSAAQLAKTGELLFYGHDSAPEGIAYRVKLGKPLRFDKLTRAEEKKLLAGAAAKTTAKWIDSLAPQPSAPPKPKGLTAEALALLANADDKKLVTAAQKTILSFKRPKTARAIRQACAELDDPMVNVLRLLTQLDRAQAQALAARIIESDSVADAWWKPCAALLNDERLVRRFTLQKSAVSGLHYGLHELKEWAQLLGGNPAVSTELLIERLRFHLHKARPKGGKGDFFDERANGSAEVATFFAASLLLERKAWKIVPELAMATFGHSNWQLRATLGELFLFVDVAIDAPTLDRIERNHFPFFDNELKRRLRLDARKAFDELAPLLEDYGVRADVFGVLRSIDPTDATAVLAREPRWKPFWLKHPGA